MKYEITSTKYWDDEKLIDNYPELVNYGYECLCEKETYKNFFECDEIRHIYKNYINIYSLEELTLLIKDLNKHNSHFGGIIIDIDEENDECHITIYDDYIE